MFGRREQKGDKGACSTTSLLAVQSGEAGNARSSATAGLHLATDS